jgi:CHAD domain-containing protein
VNERLELLFRASHDPGEVFTVLSSRYTVIAEPSTVEQWTCLDTADWRLHRAGMTLRDRRRGRSGELVLTAAGGERVVAPARAGTWPRRMELIPPSAVRSRVASTVGVRALLPMAAVHTRSTRLRLLDDEAKTRVRVQIDQQRLLDASRAPLPLRVVVTALRGYERDARRCAQLLGESLGPFQGEPDAVSAALSAAGRRPEDDAARMAAPATVDPSAPAAHSIAGILLGLADAIDAARPGVAGDIDPEFLNEMRTALRTARSILTSTADVLAGEHVEHFIGELGWLARLTTPLRDSDLLALELLGHGQLDLTGLGDLDPLRRHLGRQRKRALRIMRDALASNRTAVLISDLHVVLERIIGSQATGPLTSAAAATCAQTAYAQLREAAAAITATTPTAELHVLRGDCELLQHLLEAFRPAFDPQALGPLLDGVSRLHRDLVAVQDAEVQCHQLRGAAARLTAAGAPVESVLAVGALIDRLQRHARHIRRDLDPRLAEFCGPATRAGVAALPQLPA